MSHTEHRPGARPGPFSTLWQRCLSPLRRGLSRRGVRVYLAPRQVMLAATDGARLTGVLALPVANPGGHWQAPLAALQALLHQPGAVICTNAGRGDGASAGTGASPPAALSAAPVTSATPAAFHGDAGRQAVLAALAGGAPLAVTLSGRWCQSVMAPWSDALLAEPAATRFLQMQLAAVYGDGARTWTVASDEAPYGQPRAVCGIDTDLLQALRTQLGARCKSIEPAIGTASRMRTGMAAFALVEQGKLTLALLARGRIAALSTQPCGPAWPAELESAWRRWSLRLPELDGAGAVAVADFTGHATPSLPAPFQLVDTPFGPPSRLAPQQENICA